MSFLRLVLMNLTRRRSRSALTVLGIAIGIASVVALSSMAWGFERTWVNTYRVREVDLVVAKRATHSGMPGAFPQSLKAEIATLPHVQSVTALLGDLFSVEDALGVLIVGWEPDSFLWAHLTLRQGAWPKPGSGTVVLGALAAETLRKQVGSKIRLENADFTVAGIFSSAALAENAAIILPLSDLQALTGSAGRVNFLELRTAPGATPAQIAELQQQITARAEGLMAFTPGEVPQADVSIQLAKAMSLSTSLIALIVGATGVANTILMSVFERIAEFGLLLAIGWKRRNILKLVLLESAALGAAGGVVGCALGVVLVRVMQTMPFVRGKLEGEISLDLLAGAMGVAIALGILGGIYPAWRASRMSPTVALQHL